MPIEPLKLWKGVESSQHLDTGKGHPIRYRSIDTMAVSRTLHVVLLVAVITTVGATSKPESSCQVFQSGKTDALQWHPHSPPSSHFRVYFRVAAVSDVQIVLADGDDDDSDRIIITIGGDGNSKTSIRRPRQSAEESKTTLKELVCDYFNPYWVQFEPSSVKVGRGGKNIALLKLDLDPGQPIYPSFLGYGTSVNSVGLFIFEDFEDQWVDPCLSNPCHHGTCEPYEGEDFYWCECDHGYFGDNCETKDGEHTEWKQTEWEETRWEEEKTFQVTGHSEEIIITKEVDISLTQEFDIEKDDPVFIILHSQGTELIEIEVVKKAVYILNSLHLRLKSADLPQWCWQMKSLKLLLKFVQSGFDVYARSSTETVLIIEYRKPAQRVFTVGSIGFMSKSIKTTTLIYKRTHVSLRELGSTGHQTSTSSKQDPCDSNPCVHGECHSRPNGGYRCQCKQGYTGDKCEIEPDPCDSNPCVHGVCHSRPNGGYRCQCKQGYSGNKCEIEPDPCSSNPCVHGECHSRPNGGYRCQCKPGYSGDKCEIEPGSQIVSTAFSIVGKPTEQSTTLNPRFKADKAVDGSPSARLLPDNTCTHTEADKPNPWWRVDLGEEHCISKIRILNRGDCCSERLKGAVVRAGDSTTITDNPTCGSPVTAKQAQPLGSTIEFTCEPAFRARYVSVDIPGRATLQLCEVTVEEIHLSQCPACPDTQCSLNCPGGFERDANGCQMCDCVEISEDDEEEEPDKEGKVFQTDGGSHELIISREVNRKLEQEFVIDRNDPLEFTLLSSSGNIKIVTLITHLEVQNDKGMKLNSVKFPNWCMSHKKLKFAVDFITTGFKLLIITSSGEERLLTKYIKKSNEKFTCESLKLKAQKKKRCKVEYKPRRRCRGKYGKYLKKKHGKRRESHLKKKHGSSSSSGRKKHHKKKSHWKKRHGSSSSGRKKHRKTVKKYRKKRYRRRSGSGSD
ncbi:uncharacterized protein LOC110973026 isoform X3 [Acanthaster planci]|uniref:Uncharacterized protein LOC110973026 isoform X3 n=1 Tax=Acanthaster planci TaxID=133434 RepID=A0A8B7XGP6_ACAPL|nr:uncharacterized protein LOC110973026 isoform X3 [Acanthaster planci]